MAVCTDVNVYSSPNSCVADCPSLAKFSNKLLQGFDVAVVKNRCNHFAFFTVASRNAHILLEFPFSPLCIPSRPGAVAVTTCCVLVSARSEELCCKLCGSVTGDVVHFYFNPNRLVFEVFNLLCCFCVHCFFLRFSGACPFRCVPCYRITEDIAIRLPHNLFGCISANNCVIYSLDLLAIAW